VEASIYLKCKSPTVNALHSGKRKIILKEWVLSHTDPNDIIYQRKIPIRKKGYNLIKSYKPITIYDNKENRYISFESRKECSKFTSTSNGDISSLIKGKIMSVFGGRFSIHPLKDKSIIIFDFEKCENIKYLSQADFSRKFNISPYEVSDLIKGRIKVLKGRFTLQRNPPDIKGDEPFYIFDLKQEKILKFNSMIEMLEQERVKLSSVSDLLNNKINKLKQRFVRIEDAPTEFQAALLE
jgi:predicted XRE-type DNA-binding protein